MNQKNCNLNYFFYFIAIFILLPNRLKEVPFVLLTIFSIVYYFKNDKKIDLKSFFILSSFFWVNLFSIVYTNNLKVGFTRIEGFLPFLYIPLSYSIIKKSKIKFDSSFFLNWLKIFNYSVVIHFLICCLYFYNLNLEISYNNIRRVFDEIPLINIHPIYLSIISIIGLLSSVYYVKYDIKTSVVFFITNFIIMICCGSRVSFIAFIIILILFLFHDYKVKYLKIILPVFMLLGLTLTYFNEDFRNKFIDGFNVENLKKIDVNNSTSVRYAIMTCDFDVITQTNLIFGNGVGDVADLLNNCYKSKYPTLIGNFNSHNQYISFLLGTGFLGLISFMFYVFYIFKKAYKSKNIILMTIIVFYLFILFFENVIERKYGILLFLFFTLFGFNLFMSFPKKS